MMPAPGTDALVLGCDPSGEAAATLLHRQGFRVTRGDPADAVPAEAQWPGFVVVSAGCRGPVPLAAAARARGIAVLGERELAFQHSLCLHVAVTGASGKSTTAQMIAHILRGAGRRVEVADGVERPACSLVDVSRDLDLVVHVVAPAELEYLRAFRPVVGVLLNAPSDHPGTEASWDDYVRRLARIFAAQQCFDWAIVQSEALAHLHTVGVELPGKLITFSSASRRADLRAERGLLLSRLEGWSGPLCDMALGRMGPRHFAEDALAALAVGRVLRLTLEQMLPALLTFEPGPGRLESLGEADGVRFIDDSRSANLDALARALTTLASGPDEPCILLVAGGDRGGREFYDLGPVLSPRVKQAFLFGEAATSMRAAWSLFTPCTLWSSIADAVDGALSRAESGDLVLFSPACPAPQPLSPDAVGSTVFRNAVKRRLQHRVSVAGPAEAGLAAGSRTCHRSLSDPNVPIQSLSQP